MHACIGNSLRNCASAAPFFITWSTQCTHKSRVEVIPKNPPSLSKSECLIFLLGTNYLCVRYKGWPCFLDELFSRRTPRPWKAQKQKYKAPEKTLWPGLFSEYNQAHFMLFNRVKISAFHFSRGNRKPLSQIWGPVFIEEKKDDKKDTTQVQVNAWMNWRR